MKVKDKFASLMRGWLPKPPVPHKKLRFLNIVRLRVDALTVFSCFLIFSGFLFYLIPPSFMPYIVKYSVQIGSELEVYSANFSLNFDDLPHFEGANLHGYIYSPEKREIELYGDPTLIFPIQVVNRSEIEFHVHTPVLFFHDPYWINDDEVKVLDWSFVHKIYLVKDGLEREIAVLADSGRDMDEDFDIIWIYIKLVDLEAEENVTPPYSLICRGDCEYWILTTVDKYYVKCDELLFWRLDVNYSSITIKYYHFSVNYPVKNIAVRNVLVRNILRDRANLAMSLIGALILVGKFTLGEGKPVTNAFNRVRNSSKFKSFMNFVKVKRRTIFVIILLIFLMSLWHYTSPRPLSLLSEKTLYIISWERNVANEPWLIENRTINTIFGSVEILIGIVPDYWHEELLSEEFWGFDILIGKLREEIANPLIRGFTIKVLSLEIGENDYFVLHQYGSRYGNDGVTTRFFLRVVSQPPLNVTIPIKITYQLYALLPLGFIPLQSETVFIPFNLVIKSD
ncbi:MAG: hypothetical protein NDF54_03960 [archaeon GB-1867-035]|nr:hypothetical protein [Candidatus Culexmicrobium profundum]